MLVKLVLRTRQNNAGQVSPHICHRRSPVHAVITKVDRMKSRQGESLFLNVDVADETKRVFGRPEELPERLEASCYDIPASEIEAGMELHLSCLVKVGQGHNGYKNIEEFLPEAAAGGRSAKMRLRRADRLILRLPTGQNGNLG
jgi:hypothetical protein